MQTAFQQNQSRLQEQAGQGFAPQEEMHQRVAAQRSANEQNINKSSGEIGKKQSTVQASSDILKEEHSNVQGQFARGYETEKARQDLIPQDAKDQDIQTRLEQLRKRAD